MTILIQSSPSNGATALVQELQRRGYNSVRRRRDSTSRIRASSMLVNWGCSSSAHEPHLNETAGVADAVNKKAALTVLEQAGVDVPLFFDTPPREDVRRTSIWLARHSLTGSGGDGITIVRSGDTFPEAPLYVQYIPKIVEFRVHAFRQADGFRILLRQKLRESSAEQTPDQRLIRNRDNGWVFGLVRDESGAAKAAAEAEKAIDALGLDFGAVDVIIGRDDGVAYVLEVNTAPGLEAEATVNFYADNIIERYTEGSWRHL